MMKWIYIDERYLKQLREIEPRIPLSEYGKDKFVPFFGALFEKGELSYVTQVFSPKPRHHRINNQKDFKKIYDQNNRLLCVVNLNYMFPIPTRLLEYVEYKNIDHYRLFNSELDKSNYIKLLEKELAIINTMDLSSDAINLYHLRYEKPNDSVSKRCFDFKYLEEFAKNIQ